MDKDGGNLRQLTHSWREELSAVWWPSCEWIYFQTDRDSYWEIHGAGGYGTVVERLNWEIYRTNQLGTVIVRVTDPDAQDLIDSQMLPPPVSATH